MYLQTFAAISVPTRSDAHDSAELGHVLTFAKGVEFTPAAEAIALAIARENQVRALFVTERDIRQTYRAAVARKSEAFYA